MRNSHTRATLGHFLSAEIDSATAPSSASSPEHHPSHSGAVSEPILLRNWATILLLARPATGLPSRLPTTARVVGVCVDRVVVVVVIAGRRQGRDRRIVREERSLDTAAHGLTADGQPRQTGRAERGEPGAPSRVVLPQQNGLVVDEFAALRVHNLPPEVLVLEQIEKVQTHRILEVLGVLGVLPVQQIL